MKRKIFTFKVLSLTLVLLMCLAGFSGMSFAAASPMFYISGSEAAPGELVTVVVNISDNPGIAGFCADLTYDPSVLTPVSAKAGSALTGGTLTSNLDSSSFDAKDGMISFAYFSAADARNNGAFLTLTFRVNQNADAALSVIGVTCSDASNQNGEDVIVNSRSGAVSIKEAEKDKEEDTTDKEEEKKVEIKLRNRASQIKYMVGRGDKFEPDSNATRYEVVECFFNLFDVDVATNNTKSMFKDVDGKHVAMVNLFATAGVIKGMGDGTFQGNKTITRAEFCVFVVNLMGLDIKRVADQGFPDVKGNNWYVPYVNACAKAGYVKGRDTGEFDPNGLITRAEVATLINRITKVNVNAANDCPFDDVDPGKWYYKQVAAAAKK